MAFWDNWFSKPIAQVTPEAKRKAATYAAANPQLPASQAYFNSLPGAKTREVPAQGVPGAFTPMVPQATPQQPAVGGALATTHPIDMSNPVRIRASDFTPEQVQEAWNMWGPSIRAGEASGLPGRAGGNIPADTATTTTTTPGGFTVISRGGYDFWIDSFGEEHLIGRTPTAESQAMTPYQQAQVEYDRQRLAAEQAAQQQSIAIQQQQLTQDAQRWQAELEAQKQARLAQLAANPASWLEYASLANRPPVIQPWMLPLMPQDYGISAGEPIPGWQSTSGANMPTLTSPSAQYMARVGPTAQAQYYGYEKARQGATPEETQWRLWSMAPPSGNYRGLTQRT